MRVLFIGTGEIGVPTLRWLERAPDVEIVGVVTQPDRPVGRAQRMTSPPVKAALTAPRFPILQPERIKRTEAVGGIAALAPQIIVVMAYGQILPQSVLDIPTVACLNLHASLLPKHRGAAPIQAAIVAGDATSGISVMHMDAGLDTGDVILQKTLALAPDETGGSLHDRLGALAPEALAEALAALAHGPAPRIPQKNANATYAPKLEREDGRLDWTETALLLERKIRAYDPWPGAFTKVIEPARQKPLSLKIFRAAMAAEVAGEPGTLVRGSDGKLTIATSAGALELLEVQLEGSRRMTVAELLRGHRWMAELRTL